MTDALKANEFYTAAEVAKIKGITKQAIIDGCKKGRYPGSMKTEPDNLNTRGIWQIPKHLIDTPVAIQDVVTLNKAMTPQNIEQLIINSTRAAIKEEIEPLRNEVQQLRNELESHYRRQDERIREVATKPKGFWQKLFG